jgi:hypothetical protein
MENNEVTTWFIIICLLVGIYTIIEKNNNDYSHPTGHYGIEPLDGIEMSLGF